MNTCAIREHAEQRVFGNLGALTHTKRRHPDQKIFLCGCMAGQPEVEARLRKSFPHVDGVFSTHHLWQFPEILPGSSLQTNGFSIPRTSRAPLPRVCRSGGRAS